MRLLQKLLQNARLMRSRVHSIAIESPRYLAAHIGWRCGVTTGGRRGRIAIGRGACIEQGAIFHAFGGTITLGRDVFIGPGVVIYGHGGVTIGDECLISMHCRILSSEHTIAPAGVAIRTQPDIPRPTRLGRDVWLGAGVTVLGGVTIGEGCVVGAGAVVTRDLPPHSIATGVPARVTGHRPTSAAQGASSPRPSPAPGP